MALIVFGFPGALASVALCGLGIARLKPLFLLLGAVLATPSAFYLGLAGWWPMLLIPGFPLGAAAAIISQRRVLASISVSVLLRVDVGLKAHLALQHHR